MQLRPQVPPPPTQHFIEALMHELHLDTYFYHTF